MEQQYKNWGEDGCYELRWTPEMIRRGRGRKRNGDREALLSQDELPINIKVNKELKVKVLNPNFCSWWGRGGQKEDVKNRGLGRVLFVLFPGAGVGGAS